MSSVTSERTAWRVIAILSVVSAGAYVGNEAAVYFWDVTGYVGALDTEFPYRFQEPYPFLYPPTAKHFFTLARSHLFEFLSIALVAAVGLFLRAFASLNGPRQWEWLFAITSMGGLGVVSLLSGNVGNVLNLSVFGTALLAAIRVPMALPLLPIVVGLGALIKPQFGVYLGLLPFLERFRGVAMVKFAATGVAVVAVHALYIGARPVDWQEYTNALFQRTVVEKDFAWGPAGLVKLFSDANVAGLAAFVAGLLIVAVLAYMTWWRSTQDGGRPPDAVRVSLVFMVLTFANPRMPPYDVFVALLALMVCCVFAARTRELSWVLVVVMAVNLVPWTVANFARTPSMYPWWMQNILITHLLGFLSLLITLSRGGTRAQPGQTATGRISV